MPDLILNYSDVRFDESGKPYWTTQRGARSYLSPAAAAQSPNLRAREWAAAQGERISRDATGAATGVLSNAAPQGGFVHSRGTWNPTTGQFDQSLNPGGLMGAIQGGAALAGPLFVGPAIANAIGAGATAAPVGSLSADGTIPFTTAPGVQAAALSGQVGPAAGLGASGSVAGGAAGGAGAASGGLAGLLKNLTSGNNLGSLVGLGTTLAHGLSGGGGADDELKRIQAITEARMRRVDPLHQAITNLAMSRLPTTMQLPVPNIPLPGSGER